MRRILKSIAVGIVVAVLVVVLGIFVELALALRAMTAQMGDAGGLGSVSVDPNISLYGLIGFAAGFYWQFSRGGRRTLQATLP